MDQHADGTTTAPARARLVADLGVPQGGEKVLLVGRLHVVAHHAVDRSGGDSRVIARGEDGLDRHVELKATQTPGERRLPDADDG
jgi:hypothetical protein